MPTVSVWWRPMLHSVVPSMLCCQMWRKTLPKDVPCDLSWSASRSAWWCFAYLNFSTITTCSWLDYLLHASLASFLDHTLAMYDYATPLVIYFQKWSYIMLLYSDHINHWYFLIVVSISKSNSPSIATGINPSCRISPSSAILCPSPRQSSLRDCMPQQSWWLLWHHALNKGGVLYSLR